MGFLFWKKKGRWTKGDDGGYTLDLGHMVLRTFAMSPSAWVVVSSHGQPQGQYGDAEAAMRYAQTFAVQQLERALGLLTDLEAASFQGQGVGWKPRGKEHVAFCGVYQLKVEGDSEAVVAKEKARAMSAARKDLQSLVADLR